MWALAYALNTATLGAGAHNITVSATDSDSAPDSGSFDRFAYWCAAFAAVLVYTDAPAALARSWR